MLPTVMRWLGLAREGRAERRRERVAELKARHDAVDYALEQLRSIATERHLARNVVSLLRERHHHRMRQLPDSIEKQDELELHGLNAELQVELIAAERAFLYRLLRNGKLTDEARRRIERELDLEEAMIETRRSDSAPL
jgi:CPA1 family monovalent cation:H+ antiporter